MKSGLIILSPLTSREGVNYLLLFTNSLAELGCAY